MIDVLKDTLDSPVGVIIRFLLFLWVMVRIIHFLLKKIIK